MATIQVHNNDYNSSENLKNIIKLIDPVCGFDYKPVKPLKDKTNKKPINVMYGDFETYCDETDGDKLKAF